MLEIYLCYVNGLDGPAVFFLSREKMEQSETYTSFKDDPQFIVLTLHLPIGQYNLLVTLLALLDSDDPGGEMRGSTFIQTLLGAAITAARKEFCPIAADCIN